MDYTKLQFILKQLKQSLQNLYGKKLVDIILFGSYAKKMADQNSDVDILIILDDEFDLDIEIARTSYIIANLCLEYDLLISRLFMSQAYYTTHQSALLRNIHQEGIQI
jgi:predicted nucleotidyltransferase